MGKYLRDEPGDYSPEMYNTDDVTFSMKDGRRRNEVILIAKSDSDLNLVKYYLALKAFIEKIEVEMDIMGEAPDEPQ